MINFLTRILFISAVCFGLPLLASAQASADNQSSVIPREDNEREYRPRNIRESLEKMRIEREKKEFDKMIERGEEVLKIAEELEISFAQHGRLTEKELAKIATVEKLAKQIRKDLGGGDDKEEAAPEETSRLMDVVRSLKSSTEELFDELKKTSRFTISAAAIKSSNSVLRFARFLKLSR
jgi:hypothetical protein